MAVVIAGERGRFFWCGGRGGHSPRQPVPWGWCFRFATFLVFRFGLLASFRCVAVEDGVFPPVFAASAGCSVVFVGRGVLTWNAIVG